MLVKKFNVGEVGTITWPVNVGGVLYFVTKGDHGTEVWRSDGTPEGTVEVIDVAPGITHSFPHSLIAVGDDLFFSATNSLVGRELWAVRSSLLGDYNFDNAVDHGDYSAWRHNFGSTNSAADGNGNGVVDAADYVLWRKIMSQAGAPIITALASGSEASNTLFSVAMETASATPSPNLGRAAEEQHPQQVFTPLFQFREPSVAFAETVPTEPASAAALGSDLLLLLSQQTRARKFDDLGETEPASDSSDAATARSTRPTRHSQPKSLLHWPLPGAMKTAARVLAAPCNT